MNNADAKVKMKNVQVNPEAEGNEKRGFDKPALAMPAIFGGIAEQNVVRARDNCEKIKAASGEIADILRESYSTTAKGTADYGVKVIEISRINTNSAFDFLTNLLETKSPPEIISLSVMQSRKNLEAVSMQNRELWELAQKVATAAADTIKERFNRVLHKAS